MECSYMQGRSDNAIKNRWHLLKRASKLAATMQNSNPSSVVTSSSTIQRCSSVDRDQSTKQSSEDSFIAEMKVSISDTAL